MNYNLLLEYCYFAVMIRKLYLIGGFISLFLAFWGALLPLLPTTPFLLLAGFCFSRSSEKMHRWLHTNRVFGQYLKDYEEKRGIPLKIKILVLSFLWLSFLLTALFITQHIIPMILLPLMATIVTIHILRYKTL